MQRAVAKIICALALVASMAGCKDLATFTFAPYPDVNLTASVKKLSYHDFEIPGKTTFVHFKYTVTTYSDAPVYFKVENISVSINGTKNTGAYYDSVASIVPHWQRMKSGENVIEAYVASPGTIDASAIHDLQFVNYGLSREAANGVQSFSNETHNLAFKRDALKRAP
jgi:hypothetical protein